MGCLNSTRSGVNLSQLRSFEKSLGFEKLSPDRVDHILRKYSEDGQISPAQCAKIREVLGLASPSVDYVFAKLKTAEDSLNMHEVLGMALLLCNGDKKTKATLLFDIMDEDYSKWATFPQMRSLFLSLAKVSILVGEVYADQDPLPESRNKMLRMLETATTQKKQMIEKLLRMFEFLKSQRVPQLHFIDVLAEIDGGALLTMNGWRTAALEGGKNYTVYTISSLVTYPPQLPLPVI